MYERKFTNQFFTLFENFGKKFETTPWDELDKIVIEFGRENNANVIVSHPRNHEEILFEYIHHKELTDGEVIKTDWYTVTDGLTGGGFLLYAEASLVSLNQMVAMTRSTLLVLLLLTFLISIVVSNFLATSLARPIVRISKQSQRMGTLDLSSSSEIRRSDEIGELAYNLNDMAARLNQALTDLQNANLKLKNDMEQDRQREEQRNDLFMAISHELKTPLMILKGEIKGMIDRVGAYQNRDYYLQHVHKVTEEMEQLVHKILLVSRMDTEDLCLNFQIQNLSDVINEICEAHESVANQKGISLTYYCEERMMVRIDREQIYNAITNIVSNALLHSPRGEFVNIQLMLLGEGEGVLNVENSGIQIDEKDLKNIFEPFYRSEKSRNRNTGGSGLGLVIVKRILELHQFSYHIENSKEGVLFRVYFPI